MPEAVAAQATAEATSAPVASAPDPSDLIAGLVGAIDVEPASEEQPAETEAQAETEAPAPVEDDGADPLAEARFDDSKPWDAKRVKDLAKVVRDERGKVDELRKATHKAHSSIVAREQKFERTKGKFLQEKATYHAERQRFDAEMKALVQGDTSGKLGALARLMGRNDGAELFKELTIDLASGGKLKPAPQAPNPLEERLERIERLLSEGATQREAQDQEAQLAQLEAQQLEYAKATTDHQYVAHFAKERPDDIRQAITQIRMNEFRKTGRPIDVKTACDKLEAELKAQYQLFQGVTAGSGQNGARGTTGSGPGTARETVTNSTQAQSPPNRNEQPALIPAGLSAQSSASRRPLDTSEENEALARALPDEFFRQFGYGLD